MKLNLLLFLLSLLTIACSAPQKKIPEKSVQLVFQQKDKEIVEQVLAILSDEVNAPIQVLMVKVGTFFKETLYIAHTLETEEEKLVINLREMDCTTFAENCLANSNTIKSKNLSFEKFTNELQNIRYRNGMLNGYPSRLHYFSDWIFDNQQKGLIKDVAKEIINTPYPKQINFMSTHPESYQQLNDSAQLIKTIEAQEKEILLRQLYYIPTSKLAEVENKLMEGDIVGITTDINGIDILHVGILVRKAGRIHLMHASSVAEKVIVSEKTLEEYLQNRKSATGIMIARPL